MNHSIKKLKVGIALSGGGARGIAHIGVLAALHKYGIEPVIISGTSIGALVGVFYAAGHSPQEILQLVQTHRFHRIIQWAFPSSGLLDMDKVHEVMSESIGIDDFSSLKKTFFCAVTNLNSGTCEYISEGKLFQYVLASATIPILFEPQIIDGKTYVDGGLLQNLPVKPLIGKTDLIIGVYVNTIEEMKEINGLKNIAERCFRLAIGQNVKESFEYCDFIINPTKLKEYNTFDFNKSEEIYQIGFDETEQLILDLFSYIDIDKVIEERRQRNNLYKE